MNSLSLSFLPLATTHFLTIMWCGCVCSHEIKGSYFITHNIENAVELINSDSTTEISAPHSEMQCLTRCNEENSCSAVIFYPERNHSCFLYKLGREAPYPIRGDTNVQYLAKVTDVMTCYNGGVWKIKTQMCRCTGGWIGLFCTKRARTCHDLITSGYSSGYRTILLDLHDDYSVTVSVRCHILPSINYSRLIVLKNNNGMTNFRYSWDRYVSGFTNTFMGYWLGLERMHLLSSTAYRTLLVLFMAENGAWFGWEYKNFTILDSSRDYSMYFGSSRNLKSRSGDDVQFGDCLRPLQNRSFSTWDRDNDLDPMENCADLLGAGWWFVDCEPECNPFGYKPDLDVSSKAEFKLPGLDRNVTSSQGWTLIFQLELQH